MSDQFWLGVSFWILGLIAFTPCCIFVCVLKRAAGQKRKQVSSPWETAARKEHLPQISAAPFSLIASTDAVNLYSQRILGGHLEEVEDVEANNMDEGEGGGGKGGGRVSEMRRRGGAYKHGGDAAAGAGSHELPPLRSTAGVTAASSKNKRAVLASVEGEQGGGLSSKVRARISIVTSASESLLSCLSLENGRGTIDCLLSVCALTGLFCPIGNAHLRKRPWD